MDSIGPDLDSSWIGLARSGFDLDWIGPIWIRGFNLYWIGPIWIRSGLDWPDMCSIGPDLDSIWIGLARYGFDRARSGFNQDWIGPIWIQLCSI